MTQICRRTATAVFTCALLAVLGVIPFGATAQTYPAKPIRIIVPWAAGGSTDVIARIMADYVGKQLQQTLFVENRPGAAGTIGFAAAARADADGYTLLFGTNSTFAMAPHLYSGLTYEQTRDLVPIVFVASNQQVLCVNPSLGVRDLKSFLDHLKANPNKVTFESSGNGGSSHLAMEMLMDFSKTKMLHVPYKGGGPALQSLVANETSAGFVDMSIAIPLLRAGKLIALGVSGKNRSPSLRDVPTLDESGVTGFESETSVGIFAPKGIQADKVQRINAIANRWLKDPETVTKLQDMGIEARGGTPAEFADYTRSESEKWRGIITARGIKIE